MSRARVCFVAAESGPARVFLLPGSLPAIAAAMADEEVELAAMFAQIEAEKNKSTRDVIAQAMVRRADSTTCFGDLRARRAPFR